MIAPAGARPIHTLITEVGKMLTPRQKAGMKGWITMRINSLGISRVWENICEKVELERAEKGTLDEKLQWYYDYLRGSGRREEVLIGNRKTKERIDSLLKASIRSAKSVAERFDWMEADLTKEGIVDFTTKMVKKQESFGLSEATLRKVISNRLDALADEGEQIRRSPGTGRNLPTYDVVETILLPAT